MPPARPWPFRSTIELGMNVFQSGQYTILQSAILPLVPAIGLSLALAFFAWGLRAVTAAAALAGVVLTVVLCVAAGRRRLPAHRGLHPHRSPQKGALRHRRAPPRCPADPRQPLGRRPLRRAAHLLGSPPLHPPPRSLGRSGRSRRRHRQQRTRPGLRTGPPPHH